MGEEKSNEFKYNYSAPTAEERKEIESIKRRYVSDNSDGKKGGQLDLLRELDKKVKKPPLAVAIVVGVCGCLVFGLGLTCFLEWQQPLIGGCLGAVGVAIMAVAYPVHKAMLDKNKKKYSAQIIELSEKILNEEKGENKL